MSYIHELAAMRGADYMPSGTQAFAVEQACAEVDRLRADLAAARADASEQRRLANALLKDLESARADAERAKAELVETRIEADTMRQHHKNAEAVIADLQAAGGRPFIRSEAIRNCRETIAQQKAKLAALTAERDELRKDKERAKVENGAIHGKIGLLAERLYGIGNNLPTDETLERIAQCAQGDQIRLKRMEMTHDAFDANIVNFMQKVQEGEVTCIRAAQVIEAKLAEPQSRCSSLAYENASLASENAALASECAELRKDKERLDWLECDVTRCLKANPDGGGITLEVWIPDGMNLRSAVDTAPEIAARTHAQEPKP